MIARLSLYFSRLQKDMANLLFPNICAACSNYLFKNERCICTRCLHQMPKTNFHLEKNNPVSILFWGRVKIESATAYFSFAKGSRFQKLLHKLKYHKREDIGIELGRQLGFTLKDSEFFNEIDLLVPVPLHPRKEKLRGFNQAKIIAEGMAKSMRIPVCSGNLIRRVHTDSQTRKNKLERWENVNNIFALMDISQFRGKHILLVDDVVTTGSTLESCAHAILQAEGSKVSIATLAYA